MPEASPLRYVILRHEGIPDPHFDLMFETSPGSVLATWRSPVWPLVEIHTELVALPDHRRDYLDYEGPLSNNRGSVHRVATGTHTVQQDHPTLLIVVLDTGDSLKLYRCRDAAVQLLRAIKKAT